MVVLHWSPSGYGFLLQPGSPVTVSHVEEGLPAQLAGIQEGDALLQVEDKSVIGVDYQKVMDLIGSCQSTLQLLVQRPQLGSTDWETAMPISNEQPMSDDSIFDTDPKNSVVNPGILRKRRAASAKDLYSVGRDSNFDGDEDYVATPQKPFRGYISWREMSPLEQKRQEAIAELVKKQSQYVEELCFGIERYARPLREHKMTAEEHACLFGNIEELYSKALTVLRQLKKRRKPFHLREAQHPYYLTAIGDIYSKQASELASAYSTYMESREKAEMELSLLRIQPDFVEFLQEPPLNEGQPTIDDFLSLPQNYFGSLRRLLRKVLANTPTYHPDQQELSACIDALSNITTSHDEAQAREAAIEVLNLEKMLGFASGVERFRLVSDGRILVQQGALKLVDGKKKKIKRVHVLLFNDMLLIAKREGTLLVALEPPLDLTCIMVQDFTSVDPTEFCITVIKRAAGNRLSMASWKASHIFQASSMEEKNMWKNLIDERAKGVRTVRRKTNLKQLHTLDALSTTSPEEDLRQYEREQQQRMADLAPQMYPTLGSRNRAVKGTTSQWENPSPLRDKKRPNGPRPRSVFDELVEKSKGPKRRHSLNMADVEDLTSIVKRIFDIRIRADQAAEWKSSLRELISDPEGAELFLAFLQSEFSEENLQFWLSCEEFKKLRGPALEHKARQIYSKYVKAGAPHEVNIDSETRNTVKANLTSPTPDMFDFSQHIIYTLMERDSYRRFLRSGNFTTFESGSSK